MGISGQGGEVWRWDGNSWDEYSPPNLTSVKDLIVADLGAGERIYACGAAASGSDPCVYSLDPVALTWTALGTNSGDVTHIRMLKAAGADPVRLVAFGGLDISGTSYSVTVWDGAAWTSLGDIAGADQPLALYTVGGGRILIGGNLSTVDGVLVANIGEYRTEWREPGAGGANGAVMDMVK